MKKTSLILIAFLLLAGEKSFSQSQIITTGNNVIDTTNPTAADIVIGSNANGGVRHDGSIMWWSSASASRISNTADVFYLSVWNNSNPNIALNAIVGQPSYFLGNLLIGQATPRTAGYMLDVAGNVRANAITVNTTGADFVFEPSYKLLTLPELNNFIQKNHHLPEMASAKDMQANGVNLGDNQIKLLQKVEELTLYLIDKDKQLNDEKETSLKQQNEIDSQKEQLDIAASQLKAQQNQIDSQKKANIQLSQQLKFQQDQLDVLIKQVANLSEEK
jgi:hypothetical protein